MDDHRFDNLARTLATGLSRRGALRSLAGGAAGLLLAGLARDDAAARCVRIKDRCRRGDTCCGGARCRSRRCRCKHDIACSGKCCPKAKTCHAVECHDGQCLQRAVEDGTACGEGRCRRGRCKCSDGAIACGGVCCDVPDNPCLRAVCDGTTCVTKPRKNNRSCDGDGKCLDGTCNEIPDCDGYFIQCSTGDTCCSGRCTDSKCEHSKNGERCQFDPDCASGLICVGYRCQPNPFA